MDLNKALTILEIEQLTNLTEEYIKKKYHKLALINHPDKNGNSLESTNKFQEINEAYDFLSKELYTINGTSNKPNNNSNTFTQGSQRDCFVSSSQSKETNSKYIYLLSLFINSIIEGPNGWNKDAIKNVIKEIVILGKTISLEKIFDNLDKDSSLEVYSFISKYKHILYKNDRVFILNPSITDLLESNIFKLNVDDEIYLVPLWHNELYFDAKDIDNGDIIVLCNPELPENMTIDEDNNIHVSLDLEGKKLLDLIKTETTFVSLLIGTRDFSIPLNKIHMKKEQIYIFLKQGIANVIENDMYNVSNKADIIIKIRIV
jgi:hypothetical protein